jgi:RNA polymerase sigma-70 factor (ECF subfamily)
MYPIASRAALHETDAELMLRVQAGEHLALGELYDRFAPRALRVALAVCRDSESAHDAVQDAFVSMWTSRATYHPTRGSVVAWSMSIVRHRAIHLTRLRAVATRREGGTGGLERQPGPEDLPSDFAARTKEKELAQLLVRLPPAQLQVIQLGFFDGLTHQEIAQRLALPPGTVKGRMRLGLTKLRSELDTP